METIILNEALINQGVALVANVDEEQFDLLKNAKSSSDFIRVNFKMGKSHHFENQVVNHYRVENGATVHVSHNGETIAATCWNDVRNSHEKQFVECELFNSKFLEHQTVTDYSPAEDD